MTHFQFFLSVPHPHLNYLPDIHFWPLSVAAEFMHYSSAVKKPCFSYAFASSFGHRHVRPLRCVVGVSAPSGVDIDNLLNDSGDQAAGYPRSDECSDDVDHKEIQRRRRIALANKGNVPWNKGRQHTEETRLRIRQRTKEALKNPKIRKKMASHPLPHSDQSKANIRKSLRRLWANRRKRKQLGERFFLSWMGSVSEAARKGLTGQDELNWDSYEQIHQEMALQELQRAADKEKAKEMAKQWVERAAAAKAEKLAMLARKREERAEKLAMLARKREEREAEAKAKKELKRKNLRKSKKDGEKSTESGRLKLKRKVKLHRKVSTNGQLSLFGDLTIPRIPSLALEFIKNERIEREVSLEEQIREARKRRV